MGHKATLAVPLLITTVGTGWLLTNLGIGPDIDWVWTLGLGMAGVVTFLLAGVNKFSSIVGPFLLLASSLSVFRQSGSLPLNVEAPALVISFGVLMLIARAPSIPSPAWILPADGEAESA